MKKEDKKVTEALGEEGIVFVQFLHNFQKASQEKKFIVMHILSLYAGDKVNRLMKEMYNEN